MLPAQVNGHPCGVPLPEKAREDLRSSVEFALNTMVRALTIAGFTDYEIGSVNMATRFAITEVVKDRARGAENGQPRRKR